MQANPLTDLNVTVHRTSSGFEANGRVFNNHRHLFKYLESLASSTAVTVDDQPLGQRYRLRGTSHEIEQRGWLWSSFEPLSRGALLDRLHRRPTSSLYTLVVGALAVMGSLRAWSGGRASASVASVATGLASSYLLPAVAAQPSVIWHGGPQVKLTQGNGSPGATLFFPREGGMFSTERVEGGGIRIRSYNETGVPENDGFEYGDGSTWMHGIAPLGDNYAICASDSTSGAFLQVLRPDNTLIGNRTQLAPQSSWDIRAHQTPIGPGYSWIVGPIENRTLEFQFVSPENGAPTGPVIGLQPSDKEAEIVAVTDEGFWFFVSRYINSTAGYHLAFEQVAMDGQLIQEQAIGLRPGASGIVCRQGRVTLPGLGQEYSLSPQVNETAWEVTAEFTPIPSSRAFCLTSGEFVVATIDNSRIELQVYSSIGQAVGESLAASNNLGVEELGFWSQLTQTGSDTFVFHWRHTQGDDIWWSRAFSTEFPLQLIPSGTPRPDVTLSQPGFRLQSPNLAVRADRIVSTWEQREGYSSSADSRAMVQLFGSTDFQPLTSATPLSNRPNNQVFPLILTNDQGFTGVWLVSEGPTIEQGVWAQLLTDGLEFTGQAFQLDIEMPYRGDPEITSMGTGLAGTNLADGGALVTWVGGETSLALQRLTPQGQRNGTNTAVSSVSDNCAVRRPFFGKTSSGHVLGWNAYAYIGNDLAPCPPAGRLLDPLGEFLTEASEFSSTLYSCHATAGPLSDGFVAAWKFSENEGQSFASDGFRTGSKRTYADRTDEYLFFLPSGNSSILLWAGPHEWGEGVFSRAVDSAGELFGDPNLVLGFSPSHGQRYSAANLCPQFRIFDATRINDTHFAFIRQTFGDPAGLDYWLEGRIIQDQEASDPTTTTSPSDGDIGTTDPDGLPPPSTGTACQQAPVAAAIGASIAWRVLT